MWEDNNSLNASKLNTTLFISICSSDFSAEIYLLLGINYHWSISWEYSLDPWMLVLVGKFPSLSSLFFGNKCAKWGMPVFIKLILHCDFWGCHYSDYEVNCLLGCDTIYFCRCLQMIWGTCCLHHQKKCQHIPFQTSECPITEDSHHNWYINEVVIITQKCRERKRERESSARVRVCMRIRARVCTRVTVWGRCTCAGCAYVCVRACVCAHAHACVCVCGWEGGREVGHTGVQQEPCYMDLYLLLHCRTLFCLLYWR